MTVGDSANGVVSKEQIRRARRQDVWDTAGFAFGPVACTVCNHGMEYRKHSGRAFCQWCEKTFNSLDLRIASGLSLAEAVQSLLG